MQENNRRKILDWILLISILVVSVIVFIFREKIQALGNLGYIGLFLLCFLSNCTVFLPAPSLMVVVSFAQIFSPLGVSFIGALGTTLGEISGYAFGHAGQNVSALFQKIMDWFRAKIKNVVLLVFILAFLPLPLFDFAGVYAGGSKLKLWKFALACFMGKLLKMLIYAVAATELLDLVASLLP